MATQLLTSPRHRMRKDYLVVFIIISININNNSRYIFNIIRFNNYNSNNSIICPLLIIPQRLRISSSNLRLPRPLPVPSSLPLPRPLIYQFLRLLPLESFIILIILLSIPNNILYSSLLAPFRPLLPPRCWLRRAWLRPQRRERRRRRGARPALVACFCRRRRCAGRRRPVL